MRLRPKKRKPIENRRSGLCAWICSSNGEIGTFWIRPIFWFIVTQRERERKSSTIIINIMLICIQCRGFYPEVLYLRKSQGFICNSVM